MEPKQRARQRAIEHALDWWPAYLAVASAIALRLAILFSTGLVPQTDGAYYLAQVRSLLAGKGLRFSDTPLLFWVQAAVARAFTAVTPLTIEAATIAGVKIVDAVVPPLAVLPIFALWLRWTPRERRSALAAITVAALPALSFSLVHMTGDLQKNAFALVLLSFAFWAFDTASRRNHALDWALMGLALLGCALSHVGVFAAAITFAVPAMLYRVMAGAKSGPERARRAATLAVLGAGSVALAYVLSLFIPKLGSLGPAMLSPLSLFSGETTFSRLAAGLGPGSLADTIEVVLAYAPLLAVAMLWRRCRPDGATAAMLAGVSAATGVLACPFLGGIDGLRLHLMAYVPVSALFAWAVGVARPRSAKVACVAMLIANALAVAPVIPQATMPTIAEESYPELLSLKERIDHFGSMVVVARHGLEWWAAWALDAAVVPTIGATPDLWERYDTVLLLQETKVRDDSPRPRRSGETPAKSYVEGTPPVDGATIMFEGRWYRLSRADSVLDLGKEFEGKQKAGAVPRPEPGKL
ncbi:MAG: hypothetical protein VB144_08025 [Clostridia bacterium]|nr:hypothetical protein [Clostridia bacterium]